MGWSREHGWLSDYCTSEVVVLSDETALIGLAGFAFIRLFPLKAPAGRRNQMLSMKPKIRPRRLQCVSVCVCACVCSCACASGYGWFVSTARFIFTSCCFCLPSPWLIPPHVSCVHDFISDSRARLPSRATAPTGVELSSIAPAAQDQSAPLLQSRHTPMTLSSKETKPRWGRAPHEFSHAMSIHTFSIIAKEVNGGLRAGDTPKTYT